jgi:DNA repair protein RecO (recombination protein O)
MDRFYRGPRPCARQNGPVPTYRDEAVVLRTQKLGEADRIVTLLTRRHGRVRAVAKGVRRTSSRFGARLEPFSHVDLQLAEARSLEVITQAETLRPYAAQMGADYAAYTAGTVMLETAERLVVEDKEPALQQFLLLVGALRAMCEAGRPPAQVLDSFLLRSLSVAGYAPSFDGCARCGLEGPHVAFNPSAGGMLCAECRLPGSARPATETVTALGALLAGEWDVVAATDDRHLREASTLVAAYLAWHLERGLKSLGHVAR